MPAPEEAAEELLARMLEYRRYHDAARLSQTLFEAGRDHHFRRAPLPPEFRRVSLDAAQAGLRRRAARAGDRRAHAHARGARHVAHPPDGFARTAPRRCARAAEEPHRASTSTKRSAARTG